MRAPTSTWVMSIPLRQRLVSALNCIPKVPDLAPFQLPDPRQQARSLTAVLGRRQPHNVPPLHSAQVVHGDLHAGRLRSSLRGPLLPEGSSIFGSAPRR